MNWRSQGYGSREKWASDVPPPITEYEAKGKSFANVSVGDFLIHPSGRKVQIIRGYYLDPIYRRLSNHWTWKEVLSEDICPTCKTKHVVLSDTVEHDYGGTIGDEIGNWKEVVKD